MRASDVVGRTIVGIHQVRVLTDIFGYGSAFAVDFFELDNGARVLFHARETETEPIVTVTVARRRRRRSI